MKSKYIFFAVSLFTALSVNAQETYENAKLAGEDLNGTARYVGMGGAMEALGADISTIGTNPAGLGLFRHSNISLSGGFVMQTNGKDFANGNKTNPLVCVVVLLCRLMEKILLTAIRLIQVLIR